ncbi:MAG: universal stress protein [Thaumarchaeota archaeon]|nr:universal stress protein [Nitrososphaerota archaeon]
MYKTILVPHAGTSGGDKALNHAIHIADDSSRIIILHVVEQLQHPATFALASSEIESLIKNINDANKSIRDEMVAEMEKKAEICKKSNVKSDIKVTIGSPAEEILKIASDRNVDLIVMAKRRKLKGVKKLLSLGSVSRKVVENANCPVLLIDTEK